jgi:localization factor PodJL
MPPTASTELRPEESQPPVAEEETATTPAAPAEPAEETASAEEPDVAETDVATVAPPLPEALPLAPALPEEVGSARLRDAAIAGDPAAAFEIAARYAEGRGVLPDMPTAVIWYERAANVGLAPAQYRLGSIYEKGLGVAKDLEKAQEWYQRAADAGNVKAMHNLAVLYAEGAGGEPNLERAADLFRQAAERGVRDSQFNLAILHARGLGVPQDLIEAYKWFGVAASSGDAESAKRRDIIGGALSDGDLRKAEEAVATFQPVPLVSEANEVLMPEGGWSDAEDSTSIQMSSDTELVALVQKLLADNGFDPGPADGKLGRQTIEAISAFQSQAGLPETGQIDNALVAALQASET